MVPNNENIFILIQFDLRFVLRKISCKNKKHVKISQCSIEPIFTWNIMKWKNKFAMSSLNETVKVN